MRNFLNRAQKKLATAYGRAFLLAALTGILLAGMTALYAMIKDDHRVTDLKQAAQQTTHNTTGAEQTIPPNGKAIGGPFNLISQDNKPVKDSDFAGKYMLVYFGYTYCPDMCPTGLLSISKAIPALGKDAARVQPIFITVDPARDTSAKLKEYLTGFDPSIIGLTGSAEQIAAAAKSYQVYYAKGEQVDDKDYMIDHSSLIYLMGPDGKFITAFNEEVLPDRIVKTLQDAWGGHTSPQPDIVDPQIKSTH